MRAKIKRQMLGDAPWPLTLIGQQGSGKTCAALCVADMTFGGLRYWRVDEACEELIEVMHGRRDYGGTPMSVTKWWEQIRDFELVILDELGTRAHTSDHHYGLITRVLDYRIGRPTICISNHPLTAEGDAPSIRSLYDDRLASRLAGGTVIEFAGRDRRLDRDGAADDEEDDS